MRKNIVATCISLIVCFSMVAQPVFAAGTQSFQILSSDAKTPPPSQPADNDSSLGTLQDDPDTVTFAPRRPVIVAAFNTAANQQFIQLYDDDSASKPPIDMNGWRIGVTYTDASVCSIEIDNAIMAHSYSLLAEQNSSMADPTDSSVQVYTCPASSNVAVAQLRVYDHDELVERITIPDAVAGLQWQRNKVTESGRSGVFEDDFHFTPNLHLQNSPWYVAPPQPDVQVTEVLVNPRDCLPGDVDHSCYDYVKLKNLGPAIDLSSYRLRTGFKNTGARATNTIYLYGVIPAGATVRIDHNADGSPVSISANDGTVWLEDTYGIRAYDLHVPPYVGSSKTAHKGQSWAYDAKTSQWKWAVPSPTSTQNNFNLPAEPETSSQTKPTYKPCRADQYRSPDTHRCRSLTSATNTLKPCAANQSRNPLTNRCRSVLGASTSLKPCAKGQERNPDTHRCRKIQTKTTNADFAVEPIKQGVKGFAGWWALGGLAVLAAGYATWEWRNEIRQFITRVSSRVSSGK